MDYQRVILLGNTTGEVEIKQAKTGMPYAHFDVAVKDLKAEPVYFPVALFGETTDHARQMLVKGTRVLVEGTLNVDRESGKFRVLAKTWCRV